MAGLKKVKSLFFFYFYISFIDFNEIYVINHNVR